MQFAFCPHFPCIFCFISLSCSPLFTVSWQWFLALHSFQMEPLEPHLGLGLTNQLCGVWYVATLWHIKELHGEPYWCKLPYQQ